MCFSRVFLHQVSVTGVRERAVRGMLSYDREFRISAISSTLDSIEIIGLINIIGLIFASIIV